MTQDRWSILILVKSSEFERLFVSFWKGARKRSKRGRIGILCHYSPLNHAHPRRTQNRPGSYPEVRTRDRMDVCVRRGSRGKEDGISNPPIRPRRGQNARTPLSHFPLESQQEEIANPLATCDAKANFAKQKRVAIQDIFRTLLHEGMTVKIRVQAVNLKVG